MQSWTNNIRAEAEQFGKSNYRLEECRAELGVNRNIQLCRKERGEIERDNFFIFVPCFVESLCLISLGRFLQRLTSSLQMCGELRIILDPIFSRFYSLSYFSLID